MRESSTVLNFQLMAAFLILLVAEYQTMVFPVIGITDAAESASVGQPIPASEVDLLLAIPEFLRIERVENTPLLLPPVTILQAAPEVAVSEIASSREPASVKKKNRRGGKAKKKRVSVQATRENASLRVPVPTVIEPARMSRWPRDLASAAADAADENFREIAQHRQARRAQELKASARERIVLREEED